jgi:hypothetical protein
VTAAEWTLSNADDDDDDDIRELLPSAFLASFTAAAA